LKKRQKQKLSRDEIIRIYEAYIPVVTEKVCKTEISEDGKVTLFIENKGVMNHIFQKIAHKPKFSQVHLDEMGSFIWPLCDGQTNIKTIAKKVRARFGEKAEPLYDRLLKFFEIVESYEFMRFMKPAD
jgi:hypothetical protein